MKLEYQNNYYIPGSEKGKLSSHFREDVQNRQFIASADSSLLSPRWNNTNFHVGQKLELLNEDGNGSFKIQNSRLLNTINLKEYGSSSK